MVTARGNGAVSNLAGSPLDEMTVHGPSRTCSRSAPTSAYEGKAEKICSLRVVLFVTRSGPSIGSRVASIRTTTLFSWSLFILRSERKLNQLGNDLIEQGHCPSPAGRATFDLVREARHDESVSRQLHARTRRSSWPISSTPTNWSRRCAACSAPITCRHTTPM